MNKLTALVMSVLLVVGGAGAAVVVAQSGTSAGNDSIDDAELDASYHNDADELSVMALDEGEPIPNASVTLNDEQTNLTDANGTVAFDANLSDGEEVELAIEKGALEGELKYIVDNGSLVLLSEEYKYERFGDEDEQEEDEEEREDDEDADDEEDEREEEDAENEEEDESEEDEEDGEDEGEGPPDDVPRGPPDDVPRGPPEEVPRGPP